MITQAARLIVVVAFSRADNDELVPVYDPMQFDTPEDAIRMARYLAATCAGVLAWSREVQPDIGAYGATDYALPIRRSARDGVTMRVRDGINRDLVRYANDALFLSTGEKQALLREAATAIRWYRALIAFSGDTANDHGSDISCRLNQFADGIEFRYADETKAIMLEAAETIRVLRLMLGIKQDIIDGIL